MNPLRLMLLASLLALPVRAGELRMGPRPSSGLYATAAIDGIERGFRPAKSPADIGVLWPVGYSEGPLQRVRPTFHFVPPPQGNGVSEVVFFGETRIVRIRVHLKMVEGDFSEVWRSAARRAFAFFDRDGDGVLNAWECEFLFEKKSVADIINGSVGLPSPDGNLPLDKVDLDRNGSVSLDEFMELYRDSATGLLRTERFDLRDPKSPEVTDKLFKKLDLDGDGKLSEAELTGLWDRLKVHDGDENGLLSAFELLPGTFNGTPSTTPITDANAPVVILSADRWTDETLNRVYQRLLKGGLSVEKAKCPLSAEVFDGLDTNRDGKLSLTEVARWKDLSPELEVEMIWGDSKTPSKVAVLPGPDGKPRPLAASVRSESPRVSVVRIGNQEISLKVEAGEDYQVALPLGDGINAEEGATAERIAAFTTADAGQKGYLIEKDIAGPQFQELRILFDSVDRNGDGRMSLSEYKQFFAMQARLARAPLVLAHSSRTPSLFHMLDTNGDGSLSRRELTEAYATLRKQTPAGETTISKTVAQPRGSVELGSNRSRTDANQNEIAQLYQPRVVGHKEGTPLWFRRMDRNFDGDLTPIEFLGTDEEFGKIDTDRDGLISTAEAVAFDRTFREPPKAKDDKK